MPHAEVPGNIAKPYLIGIGLNLLFVAVEFFYGFVSHSLSLIADAWHNLGDVAGLAISLLALRMATLKPNAKYTYGFSKGTILASLSNSVLLLLAVGSIGYEAIQRLMHPEPPQWGIMSMVAGIGIVINSLTAFLFFNKSELNSRAAFLHMAADAGVSAGVVLGGFLIYYTGQNWLDPAISIIICLVIIFGTFQVLKSSLRLTLDGVPENVDIEAVKRAALDMEEVKNIHHLHIWALSTTKNAMTAHLLLKNDLSESQSASLKERLKHTLLHLNIQHATLELETHHTHDIEEC
jgi:cobalt-zinc-cadmium efflux system protein